MCQLASAIRDYLIALRPSRSKERIGANCTAALYLCIAPRPKFPPPVVAARGGALTLAARPMRSHRTAVLVEKAWVLAPVLNPRRCCCCWWERAVCASHAGGGAASPVAAASTQAAKVLNRTLRLTNPGA